MKKQKNISHKTRQSVSSIKRKSTAKSSRKRSGTKNSGRVRVWFMVLGALSLIIVGSSSAYAAIKLNQAQAANKSSIKATGKKPVSSSLDATGKKPSNIDNDKNKDNDKDGNHGGGKNPPNKPANYKFIAAPDLVNADIADVSKLKTYRKGQPNSYNKSYAESLDVVFDGIQSHKIKDIYVAGDLVEGHWGIDTANTGVFGPTSTYKQRVEASKKAGDFYYSEWLKHFTSRGLNAYPAIGDHELGDNPWEKNAKKSDKFDRREFNYFNFGVRKENFSKNLLSKNGKHKFNNRPKGQASQTAYAFRPNPEVQMVMVDVFKKNSNTVVAELDDNQLTWLKQVLQNANKDNVDWIIVQGHTPVIGPVRQTGSSGLLYNKGTNSAFWQLLRKEKVDMYISGEVHDTTAHQQGKGEPLQISTGGLFTYGAGTKLLIAKINGTQMELTSKEFVGQSSKKTDKSFMWQTNDVKNQPERVVYQRGKMPVAGTMKISKDGAIRERSGKLDVYRVKSSNTQMSSQE